MRRFLAAVGTLAVGANPGPAADVAKPGDPAALVQKLADPQFQARDAAAKGLLKLGGAAIPAVRHALDTTADPAVRERAEALLPRLELLAESQQVLTPTLVKLDFKEMPLGTVVEELKKRTGIPLMLDPAKVALPTRAVTLTGEVPPWQAVELLCKAAGLREDHRVELPVPKDGNSRRVQPFNQFESFSIVGAGQQAYYTPSTAPVVLVDGVADPAPGRRDTAIRVLAVPGKFEGNRVVRGTGTVLLNLDVAPLPGLNWQGASAVRVTRAEDEDGRPLFADQKPEPALGFDPAWNNPWGGGLWLGSDSAYPVITTRPGNNPRLTPVTLRTDDRAIKTLKRFEGVVVGDVHQANMPIVTIDDLPKAVGRGFDGPHNIKLKVTDYKVATDGSVSVKIHVEMPQQWMMQQAQLGFRGRVNASDDLNIGTIPNKLKFADAAGKPCAPPTQRSANYSGTQWTQTYDAEFHFPTSGKAGPPAALVLTGTKVSAVEIPFALTTVRLP